MKKRIILKFSGEIFGDEKGEGVNISSYRKIAKSILKIQKENNIELGIIVGGGNIFRGREKDKEFNRVEADNMGMIATIINGLGLQEALGNKGKLITAIKMDSVVEQYNRKKAIEYLEKGNIVIFAGGTGNPFFTTDSAAALRASELNCDLILKATNVNGIYDKDPDQYKNAKMYKRISYIEAIEKKLKVMDSTAFAMCWENRIPIIVFNVKDLDKILKKKDIGTMVYE
ncbi:MAG TPA: UMP kinase [Candidatus Pacearchaeota archaeon]|nr:UMP kinase [Candidatus Pacearchaeota archaeon]HQM24310.1 UMP kinase [Candidatus Pacearchaeota archaeon]